MRSATRPPLMVMVALLEDPVKAELLRALEAGAAEIRRRHGVDLGTRQLLALWVLLWVIWLDDRPGAGALPRR